MEDLNQLVYRAQKGEKEAFGQIYKIYSRKIYRYCYVNSGDKEQAWDLVQETFLKAWKSMSNFSLEAGGTIQAYLFRIARNLMIDLSRKKKEYPLDEALEIEGHEDFEEDLDRKDLESQLKNALSRLDETDRQIVVLRYFEELPPPEAAKILGMNEGAFRVRTHRALKKLKELLK